MRTKTPGQPTESARSTTHDQPFPIVGVGASAGGLEAFSAFLHYLPTNSGMAFVLIQHLDPRQPSGLTDLLSKATRMPVVEVTADMPIEPNHVYVIAAAVRLRMSDGYIRVEDRAAGRNLPIDYFLKSLSRENTSRAIGIVLSGTASDGTLGLKEVKAEGGITFAQEPSSAKFDGMPRSAIAAGVVDFVLPPQEIARRLIRLVHHPYVARRGDEDDAQKETESALNRIFLVLRSVTGNDFTYYKHTTIQRRIRRRMALHSSEKLTDYLAYLQENPAEVRALAEDLLICVTSFFREPESFETLKAKVLPEILKKKSPEEPIRIWVPGCATGEEAYSIAICLNESLERSGAPVPYQIFATDISESAIEKARTGIYPAAALADMSPARVKRFFEKVGGGYQIAKSIRENCIFAPQNVAKDPPFHNLDLISCCNVLIYFGPVLQKKVLSTFHYALKPGGCLMLGPSESVGPLSYAFSPLDKKIRLYSKQPWSPPFSVPYREVEPLPGHVLGNGPAGANMRSAVDVQKAAERVLLAEYAPAGVIIDDALNIVHVRGDIGPFLQVASGEPSFNLLAREGLVVSLRTAILKARQKKAAVSQQAHVRSDGAQFRDVNLKVVPINAVAAGGLHFRVLFEQIATAVPAGPGQNDAKPRKTEPAKGSGARRESARLKQELAATREYLQSIIEEQEASTEELKSANEEAQASNEELETSKEELQSSNEELNTLNDELKTRNTALADVNNDLTNVLASIDVPMVMVGKDLKIRRFTPSMEPMLNFIDSDIGRSISDLKPNIDVPDLPELLRAVVSSGRASAARETLAPDGRWYSLRALPYRIDSRTEGALLVMLDIDTIRRSRDFTEAIAETVREPLVILTKELAVRRANLAFYETFRTAKEYTENRFLYELGIGQWNIPKLRELLEKVLPEKGQMEGFEVDQRFPGIGRRTMLLNAREIRRETPFGEPAILLAIEDITERKQYAEHLRRLNEDLKHFAYAVSHDLQEPLRMVISYTQLLSRDYKGKLDKDADQYIEHAVEGAQRMEDLLRGMREYWEATERGQEHNAAVDTNEVLKKALLNLQEAIARNGAAVTCDSLPPIWADEISLVQLFQNLVGNAIKYRSEKPPQVHVSAAKNARQEWVFSVKDNGTGIDPKYAEKVFVIFSRLHGRKYEGSGIGLTLCRKIVERLGGRIWVESKLGKGSVFKFTLPAIE